MDNGGSAAQFLELDNKSPWYIELSASPALVPVCIGCSLSLQLSAWGGTVNDVFVLRSPFVLSWFLEQHKQAWNLFYLPRKKKREASKSVGPQFSVVDKKEWIWSLFFFFLALLCLSEGRCSRKRRHSSRVELSRRNPVNCEFTDCSHELSEQEITHSLSTDKHVIMCQWTEVGLEMNRTRTSDRAMIRELDGESE